MGSVSDQTSYIEGLEILAAIAVLLAAGEFLRGAGVVCYFDNANTRGAIVHGSSVTVVIRKMIQISWRISRLMYFGSV